MKLPLQPRHSSQHLAPATSPAQPVRGRAKRADSFIRGAAPSNNPRTESLAGANPAVAAASHVTLSCSHSTSSAEQRRPAPSPLSAGLTSAQQLSCSRLGQARPQVPTAAAEPTSSMAPDHRCHRPSATPRRLVAATKPQAAALGATEGCRNITWQEGAVSRATKERLLGQRGCVIWFTGLSGSGKSTVAIALEHALAAHGRLTTLLDGDNIRHGLNCNLGFSPEDREENIRRIGEVAKLMMESGVMTLASFISPYQRDRDLVRSRLSEGDFIEVHMNVPLEVCESRDPKGLYKLARAGKIRCFTGVDDPYEPPPRAEIVLQHTRPDGSLNTPDDMAAEIVDYLQEHHFLQDRSCASNGTAS